MTCLPACAAATTRSRWVVWGVAMTTASMSLRASRASADGSSAMPCSCASRGRASRPRPRRAASRTGRRRSPVRGIRLMYPDPSMPKPMVTPFLRSPSPAIRPPRRSSTIYTSALVRYGRVRNGGQRAAGDQNRRPRPRPASGRLLEGPHPARNGSRTGVRQGALMSNLGRRRGLSGRARLAWFVVVACLACVGVIGPLDPEQDAANAVLNGILVIGALAGLLVVGALLVTRVPGNAIGSWLVLAGVLVTVSAVAHFAQAAGAVMSPCRGRGPPGRHCWETLVEVFPIASRRRPSRPLPRRPSAVAALALGPAADGAGDHGQHGRRPVRAGTVRHCGARQSALGTCSGAAARRARCRGAARRGAGLPRRRGREPGRPLPARRDRSSDNR